MRFRMLVIMMFIIMLAILKGCSSRSPKEADSHESEVSKKADITQNASITVTDEPNWDLAVTKLPASPEASQDLCTLRDAISEDIEASNELLEKSSGGKNNLVAQLFGLSELLDGIETSAGQAIEHGAEAINRIETCESKEQLFTYRQKISDFREKLEKSRNAIKEARKAQDVDDLEDRLSELNEIIIEYDNYLMEVQ